MRHRLPSPHTFSGQRSAVAGGAAGIAIAVCSFLVLTIGAQPIGADSANSADAAALDSAASSSRSAATITSAPAAVKQAVALAEPAVASGPVTGGTVVTLTGEELTQVSAVQVGGVPAAVVEATPTTLSYQVPVAADLSTGTVPVELFDVTGAAVSVATELPAAETSASAAGTAALPADGGAAAADSASEAAAAGATANAASGDAAVPGLHGVLAPPAPERGSEMLRALVLTPAAAAAAEAAKAAAAADAAASASASQAAPAMLSFEYLPDPRVTAQTDYLLQHWADYNPAYMAIYGNDCANFTSQGLIARGWQMDAEWGYSEAGGGSAAWVSSTAFRDYMAAHPERGVAIGDDQRASLKVGDIAQFDWDNSGDRDHTATITRIDKTESGVKVYVAGHSKDSDYWDVDVAIAGGGSVSYWGLS
ncbi:IPT/TIG domain-containing protein [Microterricola gilva]|uniref:IPT/TIG domain-containing protein n=1 Tax=Microterricola gilva TaxID=393267 RepID=A0A4Q8ARK2_9MICO|nr:amidase domain-containing protein [Microterricola gilva]RZU66783.1 IPT/TIG domain-containing protein [Microterricola gilva]